MRVPMAADLLLAWERGLDQSPTQRALALLEASHPRTASDELATLPIGLRDERLLRLRQWLFGNTVSAVSKCPTCGEKLDVEFEVSDVCESGQGETGTAQLAVGGTYYLRTDGYDITYRLPNSIDLLLASKAAISSAPLQLLQRCLIEVRYQEAAANTQKDTLPDSIIAAISEAMANADPQAKIELELSCPSCDHTWDALFDIAAFLWSEVHAWAHRILHDVHTLARVYGWRETDILAMSARRRQIYLELGRS